MRNRLGAWCGARAHLGLSKDGIALIRSDAGWRHRSTLLAEQPSLDRAIPEPQRLAAQCSALLADAACAGLPLCVTVDDAWARLFMVTPPHNAGSLQDLQAAAAMRFQALYDEPPADWQLEADWSANEPFLACAMPRSLLAALQQLAADNKLHLSTVMPQFVSAWNRYARALPAASWFGVVQQHCLTLGAIAPAPKRRLEAVRSIAIPADGHDPRWLQEQLARVALQLNLSAPEHLHLAGNQRQYWIASSGAPTVHNLEKAAFPATALSAAVMLARSTLRS